MPGYNHSANCTCGWCFKTAGQKAVVSLPKPFFTRQFNTFESFTNPNESCPVCGAAVFFYQSPYGGRVFFDELGPPWPKHPYTSSEAIRPDAFRPAGPSKTVKIRYAWQIEGWQPVQIVRIYREDDWLVAAANRLNEGSFLRILFDHAVAIEQRMVVQFRGWDEAGRGQISYLDAHGASVTGNVFSYSDFILKHPPIEN